MPQNLLVPLRLPRGHGFYNANWQEEHLIEGHRIRLVTDDPHYYLVIENVSERDARQLLDDVQRSLQWACVKIGFSMRMESPALRPGVEQGMIVDGGSPVLFSNGDLIKPVRVSSSSSSHDGDVLLLRALEKGSTISTAIDPSSNEIKICCELFSAVDFEATSNAQFITLTSILEILSRPAQRPVECVTLLDEMCKQAKEAAVSASSETQEALNSLEQSSQHWKKESFRGAIRIMAKKVASAFGDADLFGAGKNAVALYDKRSGIVHRAENASHRELSDLRQLVRETLALELGCIDGIREAAQTERL